MTTSVDTSGSAGLRSMPGRLRFERRRIQILLASSLVIGCRGVAPVLAERSPPERWGQSVFTLFVVAQNHPCPFHAIESDDLFGPLPGHGCKSRRIGSGFLIGEDGSALTNHHVIENAVLVEAAFGDGKRISVEIVGSDPETDVALLRLSPQTLLSPALTVGHPERSRVGDTVFAIGSPIDLPGTTNRGIISHLNRVLADNPFVAYIQSDVGLHPGNSGGPLLDRDGHVIGMNTALIHSEGLGFSVPIDLALRVADTLRSFGHVPRGSLGIFHQALTPDLAIALGVPSKTGLLITDVLDGGPAADAGLKSGDVVVALNRRRLTPELSYEAAIANLEPGSTALLDVEGEGAMRRMSVRVVERSLPPPPFAASASSPLGMTLSDPPEGSFGALVLDVEPGGPAERAGLEREDVVVEAARQAVRNLSEFRAAVTSSLSGSEPILLRIRRGSRHLFAVVVPAQNSTNRK
ncbi:MAG: trypsin-like peptidase domain-containing protein [Planctomycetes bacterium]|nr:trypsin-like peptidase domain-containing protein [Planctomycetota bacterium]